MFVVYVLLVGLIYYYQTWYFATYYYDVKPEYMTIRKGPITPSEINIMYQKIQDVYVDQDLFDRFFGLYDVHIATATFASHNLAHVDGLVKENAEALRDELLGIFKSKISTK
jgi:membrane protein YdbS with pleckstrin-like domain